MPKNKKTTCAEDLRARILTLDIAPGSDLDEASLAQEYGISRTPLREVLHRLAGAGYVRLEENRGAKVESMDFATMRVFFQTAPLIYCSIARQAAENRTSRQLADLKTVQTGFAKAARAGEVSRAGLLNHQFHQNIGEMARNPYLMAGLNRMLVDHTRLSQTFFAPKSDADSARVAKAIEQHEAMISAIEAQQSALAIDLTLQHWDLSRDQIEKYVRPDPLPLDVISIKERRNAF
ncbi:MAG: GntR family transcriptional regulator [Roseobacter sp.]|nr:GntR family transcriptional regulator [Roseobacter sp.]